MKRKLEEIKSQIDVVISEIGEPPKKRRKVGPKEDCLICPVTKEVFVWPVTVSCGHTFEHSILEKVDKCPLCRKTVLHFGFSVNFTLIEIIDEKYPNYRKEKVKEFPLMFIGAIYHITQVDNKRRILVEYLF